MASSWKVNGQAAAAADLREAMQLEGQHAAKQRRAAREAAEIDANARAVARGAARALAGSGGGRKPARITCRPERQSGQRSGGVKLAGFERALGLNVPGSQSGAGKSGGGGRASSFHFRLTPRGLGRRRAGGRGSYSRGEAVRAVRYILRALAREVPEAGVVSSISTDPDEIATVFAALEELEIAAGRANANVYTSAVVSLPHELDADQREALLVAVCEPLADAGLPFAAVLHKPDPRGDQRNYHAHILFSWRPVEKLEDGAYAFQATTLAALNTPEFITAYRAHAAECMNEAMAHARHARRFSPLSRAARGEVPADPAAAKKTPGRNHAERRAAAVAAAKEEMERLEHRRAVLADLARSVEAVRDQAHVPDDLRARLQRLERGEVSMAEAAAKPVGGVGEDAPAVPRPDVAPAALQHEVAATQVEPSVSASAPVPDTEAPSPAARTVRVGEDEAAVAVSVPPAAEAGAEPAAPRPRAPEPSSVPGPVPSPPPSDSADRSREGSSPPTRLADGVAIAREAARARPRRPVPPASGPAASLPTPPLQARDPDPEGGHSRRVNPDEPVPEAEEHAARPAPTSAPDAPLSAPEVLREENDTPKRRSKGPASRTGDAGDEDANALFEIYRRGGLDR